MKISVIQIVKILDFIGIWANDYELQIISGIKNVNVNYLFLSSKI